MIGLSLQAAWSMAPACEPGGFGTHQSVHTGQGAVNVDAAFEAVDECERMVVSCPAAVWPAGLPQLALFLPSQSFDGSLERTALFLTDGPKRPPRAA